jgi:hypothetical protein
MSTSQRVLRALIVVPSVGLALLAAFATPRGTVVGALLVIILTAFAALDPGSRVVTLLLAAHGVNWLSSAVVPARPLDWLLTLVASVAVLTIHLAASLAVTLPPAAPLPRATLRRWLRRAVTVMGLSVPVWTVLVSQSRSTPPGVPLLTYAAVASVAILALAFWLTQSPPSAPPAQPPLPHDR